MNQIKERDKLTPDATIQQIIDAHNEAEELLASIGLQPSQHQGETLRSVCQQRHWSEVEVLDWVKKHTNGSGVTKKSGLSRSVPAEDESLKKWAEYYKETYLAPIESLLEEIEQNFPRVNKIHGNQYPWLKNMQWHYEKFSEALRMYQKFERDTFLPTAKALNGTRSTTITHGMIKRLEKCFSVIDRDQKRINRLMDKVKRKGKNFENPLGACSTLCILNEDFRLLQDKLETQFEFENKQLIPRVEQVLDKAS